MFTAVSVNFPLPHLDYSVTFKLEIIGECKIWFCEVKTLAIKEMQMRFTKKGSVLWLPFKIKITCCGASLVAQWLRVCLPMQGTRVRALVWEDPTCHGATGPVSHNG